MTALEMINAHLKAVEELATRMGYSMHMEASDRGKSRGERILVVIEGGNVRQKGGMGEPYEGIGSTFAVALKRAIIALQDDVIYMHPDDMEDVLSILDRSGVL